jgi:hypothetical protein
VEKLFASHKHFPDRYYENSWIFMLFYWKIYKSSFLLYLYIAYLILLPFFRSLLLLFWFWCLLCLVQMGKSYGWCVLKTAFFRTWLITSDIPFITEWYSISALLDFITRWLGSLPYIDCVCQKKSDFNVRSLQIAVFFYNVDSILINF